LWVVVVCEEKTYKVYIRYKKFNVIDETQSIKCTYQDKFRIVFEVDEDVYAEVVYGRQNRRNSFI
jgi:hypothetical protein